MILRSWTVFAHCSSSSSSSCCCSCFNGWCGCSFIVVVVVAGAVAIVFSCCFWLYSFRCSFYSCGIGSIVEVDVVISVVVVVVAVVVMLYILCRRLLDTILTRRIIMPAVYNYI